MAGIVVLALVVVVLWRRKRRKAKVRHGADVLGTALGYERPYRGPKWKVGPPWM